jgi:hypothetical protein
MFLKNHHRFAKIAIGYKANGNQFQIYSSHNSQARMSFVEPQVDQKRGRFRLATARYNVAVLPPFPSQLLHSEKTWP